MNSEALIPGMKFVLEKDLTPKEIEVLLFFLERPHTNNELVEKMNVPKTTIFHKLRSLRLKKILILKNRDDKGNNLYEFNKDIL